MSGPHLHLTVQNKILVHLMDYRSNREDFEVPHQVTQAGISRAINIQQKHLPRALKKLKIENYLEEKMTHVHGVKQKRKVYFLTEEGIAYAWEFINNLMKKEIPVVNDTSGELKGDGSREIDTLENLHRQEKSEFPLLEILMFIDEKGFFNRKMLKQRLEKARKSHTKKFSEGFMDDEIITDSDYELDIAEEKRSPIPKFSGDVVKISQDVKRDIYYTVLKQAWQDGQITKDEQDILVELQKKLGITADEHKKIEHEIRAKEEGVQPDSAMIYKNALKQAWVDGIISDDEESLLRELRRTLKISDEQHRLFEKELKLDKKDR